MNEYEKILAIVSDLGYPILKNFNILDLGCGDGEGVSFLRSQNFNNVIGCDFEESLVTNINSEYFFAITKPYRLPFEDETFDFIYTSQVFEHIQNYSLTLSEIARVLKPNGFSLNIFPPKWRWIEPHIFVPLAGVIQTHWWLLFWSKLGIRNQFQKNQTASEVALLNYNYLHSHTNYLSRKEIYNLSKNYFDKVKFCELIRAKYSKYQRLYVLLNKIPFFQEYLGHFNMQVLFLRK